MELFVDAERRRCSGFLVFDVTMGGGGVGVGAEIGEDLGSMGVPVTFKMGSGSPVYGLKVEGDDGGRGVKSMRAGSDPELDFASESLKSREGPKFTDGTRF